MKPVLAPMTSEHADDIIRIYAEGIATGEATFEPAPPAWADWDASHLAAGRFVCLIGGAVAGWAALSPVSDRCVYGGVAEVSVYVGEGFRGKGAGSLLLSALVAESEAHGFWTLQAGIFAVNEHSVSLHEKHGFRVVGYRERLGKQDGRWRDVLLLERRSSVVGVD